jgi:hypothetical protein
MGATKPEWRGGQLAFYDETTHERVRPIAPRVLIEDFEGDTLNADKWLYVDNNEATEAVNGGCAVFSLTADNTQQNAGIVAAGNSLDWSVAKGLIIEFRFAFTVLPAVNTEAHIGVLGQAQVDGQHMALDDDINEHACFVFDGSGTALIYSDDGTNDNNAIATGVVVTAGATQFHVYRIDFTTNTDIRFYIDGVGVGTATTFAMDDIASPLVEPYVNIIKTDGATSLGVMYLDYIKIWQATR